MIYIENNIQSRLAEIQRNEKQKIESLSKILNELKAEIVEIEKSKSINFTLIVNFQSKLKTYFSKVEELLGYRHLWTQNLINQIEFALNTITEIKTRNEGRLMKEITHLVKNFNKKYSDFENEDTYLTYPRKQEYRKKSEKYNNYIRKLLDHGSLFSDNLIFFIKKSIDNIFAIFQKFEDFNEKFIERRKKEYNDLFNIGKFPQDEKQKRAIITDDKYNLVVAGAGAGKTAVLTTRIAYLIKRKPDTVKPDRILALAFQSNAAEEMRERLKQKHGLKVDIRTFHSLGYQILEKAGKEPRLLGKDNHEWHVKHLMEKLWENALDNPKFQNNVINYMKLVGNEDKYKEEADFETKEDFYNYQKELELITLDKHIVKSFGEQEIMNFFLTHKINGKPIEISYEAEAEWMEYEDEKGVKKIPSPDFHLPDFDIYIEHWAIDGDGKSWFGEEYIKNMKLKKKKFQEENKVLIETTYSEYKNNPNFTKLLKEKTLEALKNKNPNEEFEFTPIEYRELVEKVWDDCKTYVEKLPQHIGRFISIAKTYNFSPEMLQKRLKNEKWTFLQKTFGKIALRIYIDYQKEMKNLKKIDFYDMINDAIQMLHKNKDFYRDKLDHILIDEYQDISKQRFELIKTLMDRNPSCKLFCVGDDWQSIMSFSGSNLKYFVDFGKYFPHPMRTDLEMNYRSIKSIVDTGSELIEKNSGLQLNKKIKALNEEEKPIKIFTSKHKKGFRKQYYKQIVKHSLNKIENYMAKHKCKPEEIMILTRITKNPMFNDLLKEYNTSKNLPISFRKDEVKPSKNKIYYMSVHQSKGLESKIVFILDVVKGTYGFPCELENPTIFDIARDDITENKIAEERRLFYVALTRAKEEVVIYTQRDIESQFLREISKNVSFEELSY